MESLFCSHFLHSPTEPSNYIGVGVNVPLECWRGDERHDFGQFVHGEDNNSIQSSPYVSLLNDFQTFLKNPL